MHTQTDRERCLPGDRHIDRQRILVRCKITLLWVACGDLLPFPPDPLPPLVLLVLRLLVDRETPNALLGCTFKRMQKKKRMSSLALSCFFFLF